MSTLQRSELELNNSDKVLRLNEDRARMCPHPHASLTSEPTPSALASQGFILETKFVRL